MISIWQQCWATTYGELRARSLGGSPECADPNGWWPETYLELKTGFTGPDPVFAAWPVDYEELREGPPGHGFIEAPLRYWDGDSWEIPVDVWTYNGISWVVV